MEPQETRDNSGALFTNDRREKETHPHKKGSARINGVDYWISGWMKTSKDGVMKYLSLAFTPKDAARAEPLAPTSDDQW
jgi:hypothetical protein